MERNEMGYSDDVMVTILLCSYIGIKADDDLKPFSLSEWNTLLDKLEYNNMEPGQILGNAGNEILDKIGLSQEEKKRIQVLLNRGARAALELDDFSRKGIYIVTRGEKEYPVLLRKRLKKKTPPVLYYAGDLELTKNLGIAVVGSRNIDSEGIAFTEKLVKKACMERLIVYSGGAKGVDTVSEKTALENGGAVVSFLADSLSSKIKKKEVISAIQQNKLLLISDVKPDVGFSASRAMNRNKYIYTASYGAFVIAADYNKGGTWTGAIENIRNSWVKTFVWNNKKYNGNLELMGKGAIGYELNNEKLYNLIMKKDVSYVQEDLFKPSSLVKEEIKNE